MRWYITVENGKEVIRGGEKNQRYPLKKYKAFQDDPEQMANYVHRLNAPADLRAKVEIRHAFINDALLDEYLTFLKTRIPQEEGAKLEMSYLRRYGLNFFVNHLGLMNPADWFAASETKWARFLLGEGSIVCGKDKDGKDKKLKAPDSTKSRRDIINAMNRFIGWYHRQRPDECPLFVFEPISPAKWAEIEGRRQLEGEDGPRTYIPPEHRKLIEAALLTHKEGSQIRSATMLMIRYGTRRSEALGFKPGDVKKGHLDVVRQQKKLGVFTILKGKNHRKTPHWLATPAEAYEWVNSITPMHPRTFADKWTTLMESLGFSYTFHDLRHSFITDMVRIHKPRDVQLAVGHKDLRTTMGYLQDDRALEDEEWRPAG